MAFLCFPCSKAGVKQGGERESERKRELERHTHTHRGRERRPQWKQSYCMLCCFLQLLRLIPQARSPGFSHPVFWWFYHVALTSREYCTISAFLKAPMAMSSSFLSGSWNWHWRTSALVSARGFDSSSDSDSAGVPTPWRVPFCYLWWCFQSILRSHEVLLEQSSFLVCPREPSHSIAIVQRLKAEVEAESESWF